MDYGAVAPWRAEEELPFIFPIPELWVGFSGGDLAQRQSLDTKFGHTSVNKCPDYGPGSEEESCSNKIRLELTGRSIKDITGADFRRFQPPKSQRRKSLLGDVEVARVY